MNVLSLAHMFPPGGGTYVVEQMKALRRLGVSFRVIAPIPWAPPGATVLPRFRRHEATPLRATVDGFEVEYPRIVCVPGQRLFYLYGLTYYLRCRWVVQRMLRTFPIDLIHAHSIMPDGFAAVLLGREFHCPVVCTLHGSDINVYPGKHPLTMRATKWALQKMQDLVAVSAALKEKARSLAPVADMEVIHNGADLSVFRPAGKREARETLGLPANQKIVLFIGNLTPVKGIEYLLSAVSQLERSQLSLVLLGEGEQQQELLALARRLGLGEICKFTGPRPHSEIPLWLSAADCLVLPSLSEGLPTVVVEAMCCGTPIVATRVGGTPEIVKSGETGLLVNPKDPVALADAIRTLLHDPPLAAALAQRAWSFAQQNLSWNGNARKMLQRYEALTTVRPDAVRVPPTPEYETL
jgi:teichuronic acid biosynthesis glycosyltransferase TuaC